MENRTQCTRGRVNAVQWIMDCEEGKGQNKEMHREKTLEKAETRDTRYKNELANKEVNTWT